MSASRPPWVYLDYNVLVYLLDGKLPELNAELVRLRDADRIAIPFTREHVVEAVRGVDVTSPAQVQERARWLLEEMSSLCQDIYVYVDRKTSVLRFTRWSPTADFQETVQDLDEPSDDPLALAVDDLLREKAKLLVELYLHILDQFASSDIEIDDLRERLTDLFDRDDLTVQQAAEETMQVLFTALGRGARSLEDLGFKPSELNNVTPEAVTAAVNERLHAAGSPLDVAGIQEWVETHAPKLGHNPIAGHLGLLGSMGYWRDKERISAASQISDLSHANLGLQADVFVTNDGRLRNRVLATVHELGLSVKVVGVDEAVVALRQVVLPE